MLDKEQREIVEKRENKTITENKWKRTDPKREALWKYRYSIYVHNQKYVTTSCTDFFNHLGIISNAAEGLL